MAGRPCPPAPESPLPSRILHAVFILVVLAVASPAWATTLAVLPMEKGAGGPELEGLGSALSGMIVSDLAGARGLTLVERQRLDALVAEIDLGSKGYLDPKTAQELGKGAGAELVLVGSYSVVADTLALDARLVEVESGKVLDGATAQGAVADFVTVEKDLVEALLAELDATLDARGRRDFYSNVPTESWDAFRAWSEGQARATAGDLEAARKAFEAALAADPDFQAAVDGLSQLSLLIAATRARDTQTRATRYTATEDKILGATTDVRTRKPGTPWSPDELGGLAYRWAVLLNRGEHCQRYDEMYAYLEAVDWDPASHAEQVYAGGDSAYRVQRRLEETLGYTRWDKSVHHDDDAVYESFRSREPELWDSTHDFLYDALSELHTKADVGMATSLLACKPLRARQREIDSTWRKRLAQHGQADGLGDQYRSSKLTNSEQLDVLLAWSEALSGAVTPPTLRRLETLLKRYPDAEESRHRTVLSLLDDVKRKADHVDRDRVGLLGLDPAVTRARLEAIETGEAPFRSDGPAWCTKGRQDAWLREATRIRKNWDKEIADQDDAYHEKRWASRLVRVVGDMGCYADVDARYASFEEAAAELKTVSARRHPVHGSETHCDSLLDGLQDIIASGIHVYAPGTATFTILNQHMNLVQLRCVVETNR